VFNKLSKNMKIGLAAGGALLFLLIGIAIASSGEKQVQTPAGTTYTAAPRAELPDPYVDDHGVAHCQLYIQCMPNPLAAAAVVPSAPPAPLVPAKAITDRQWALIAKAPASHVGERIVVFGKVTQFDAATGTGTFRGNVGGVKLPVTYGFVNYPTNSMISGDVNGLATLVEGDIFRGEVTVTGALIYNTTPGGNTTVPALTKTAYQVIGHI